MMVEVNVLDGRSGEWAVETFEIDEKGAATENIYSAIHGIGHRGVRPGIYKRLVRGKETIMSNTPAEVQDCRGGVHQAHGDVLISGLGLGVILTQILKKPEVKTVTIIEKSEDVIKLVAPSFESDKRVKIIHADALEYKPRRGEKYDVVWHDIWDNICADNLPEMRTLHKKYRHRAGWQNSWCKAECMRQERKWKNGYAYAYYHR